MEKAENLVKGEMKAEGEIFRGVNISTQESRVETPGVKQRYPTPFHAEAGARHGDHSGTVRATGRFFEI